MDESGWLIELRSMGAPLWARLVAGHWHFTDNASHAIRFSRKQDAESLCEIFDTLDVIATEHVWTDLGSTKITETEAGK